MAWEEYEKGKKEAEEKISDAEIQILDAKNEIAGIDKPNWYINDRNSLRITADIRIMQTGCGPSAKCPILFFMVAALVSLTTMTRMVENSGPRLEH